MRLPLPDSPTYHVYFEGNENRAEYDYLRHYVKPGNGKYRLILRTGTKTDAAGLAGYALRTSADFHPDRGDRIFVLADLDDEIKRRRTLSHPLWLQPKYRNVEMLFSNPSFEVFFLNHFQEGKPHFHDQDEVIEAMKKHIDGYKKNMDIYGKLPDAGIAIENCRKQHRYGDPYPDSAFSDAYVLVELLTAER